MDDLNMNRTANVAEPCDQEARSGAGDDATKQTDAGVVREGGDAKMGHVRSDKMADDGGGSNLEDEKGEDMEGFEALKVNNSGKRDGEAVNSETGALEAEPDFEKDWDADIEIEDVEACASGERIQAENVEEEGDERQEADKEESDGVTEDAQAGAQEGKELGADREQGGNAGPGEGQADAAQKAQITLPLSRVKRIVKLDPDIKQVASDALKTIALATELFLGSLAESTAHVTRAGKRSTVKVEDLYLTSLGRMMNQKTSLKKDELSNVDHVGKVQTIKSRRRYKECLGTDLEYLRPVDANQAARQEARKAKAKEKAAREVPKGVKPITDFFKK